MVKTLAAQIPKSGPWFDEYLPEPNPESIFLVPTYEREISNTILNMKNSALGHDRISAKVIKPIIDILAPPSTYITNLSFTEGVFPSELKIAQVLPLYKSNDLMLFNTYRPISLLPFSPNYLSDSCIIDWLISLKNIDLYINISLDFERTILHSWHW